MILPSIGLIYLKIEATIPLHLNFIFSVMDCLFKEDYEYITEDLKFGDFNVKIKGIEPDYGQIDACLSQVSISLMYLFEKSLG